MNFLAQDADECIELRHRWARPCLQLARVRQLVHSGDHRAVIGTGWIGDMHGHAARLSGVRRYDLFLKGKMRGRERDLL